MTASSSPRVFTQKPALLFTPHMDSWNILADTLHAELSFDLSSAWEKLTTPAAY